MHVLAISPGTGFDEASWARVLDAGVDGFMIREKDLPARALLEAALWVRGRAPAAECWVNGRLDVALSAGCGFHAPEAHPEVPQNLLFLPLPLSRPVHDPSQLSSRLASTQLLLSPIHAVPGKGAPWGAVRLHQVLDGLPSGPRVLALGGIGEGRLEGLWHPRLEGVAVIRALWESPDPARTLRRWRALWP